MSKVKHFFKQSWLLIIASFCFGLLIAITNAAWSPRIEQNKKEKLDGLRRGLIADANNFELAAKDVKIVGKKGKVTKTDVYKALDSAGDNIGFTFIATGAGFADKIELVIAVDSKCEKFFGYKVLKSNETPGFGDKIKEDFLGNQFKGTPVGEVELVKSGKAEKIDSQIVAISGATVRGACAVRTATAHRSRTSRRPPRWRSWLFKEPATPTPEASTSRWSPRAGGPS